MAEDQKKKETYPTMPIKHWWALREKFASSLPKRVTSGYLTAALSINEGSATEIIGSLKQMGLIGDDGVPTDLAGKWRLDQTYTEACDEIKQSVYPHELLDAVPTPASNRDAARNWFASKTKTGVNMSGKMAALYAIIAEGNPEGAEATKTATSAPAATASRTRKSLVKASSSKTERVADDPPAPPPPPPRDDPRPNLHIDVQIHIAADATKEQIDQVFASMAKHLYQRDSGKA
jgi:hypothetical protein